MINSIELEIVKKYIKKEKQERIMWELGNCKKRGQIMSQRFAGPDMFREDCMQPIEYMKPSLMEKCLFQLNNVSDVYFIGETYIGQMSLQHAVLRCNEGEMCIIYCGMGIGYYQGEQDMGSPPRFLLINKD